MSLTRFLKASVKTSFYEAYVADLTVAGLTVVELTVANCLWVIAGDTLNI